ncbi:hypothetical protein DFJ77DRAFT_471070 [Powellomyces hirtus]|nr:hypothetical protein DFJ77DRAFT_471070 [Powellomyces hirtus]
MGPTWTNKLVQYDQLQTSLPDTRSRSISGLLLSGVGITLSLLYFAYTFSEEYQSFTSTTSIRVMNTNETLPLTLECSSRCVPIISFTLGGAEIKPFGLDSTTGAINAYDGAIVENGTVPERLSSLIELYVYPPSLHCDAYTYTSGISSVAFTGCNVGNASYSVSSNLFGTDIPEGVQSMAILVDKRGDEVTSTKYNFTLLNDDTYQYPFSKKYNPFINIYVRNMTCFGLKGNVNECYPRAASYIDFYVNGTRLEDVEDPFIGEIVTGMNAQPGFFISVAPADPTSTATQVRFLRFYDIYSIIERTYPTTKETLAKALGATGGMYGIILLCMSILQKIMRMLLSIRAVRKLLHLPVISVTPVEENGPGDTKTSVVRSQSSENITNTIKRSASIGV